MTGAKDVADLIGDPHLGSYTELGDPGRLALVASQI
jgi:hypothetical protein